MRFNWKRARAPSLTHTLGARARVAVCGASHHGWRRRRGGWDSVPAHGETLISVRICVCMKQSSARISSKRVMLCVARRAAARWSLHYNAVAFSQRFAWLLRRILSSSLMREDDWRELKIFLRDHVQFGTLISFTLELMSYQRWSMSLVKISLISLKKAHV